MIEGLKDVVRNWVGPALVTHSYEDLAAATGNFQQEHLIGSGATGTVYRGVLRGGTDIAVKVLQCKDGTSNFDEELKALTLIRHPNIVTLLGYGQNQGWRYLVYELLKGGSVARRLWRCRMGKEAFSWQDRLRVARDASCGLAYMVNCEPKAFHRDIKPSNILLDEHGTAKVSDFGLVGIVARQETLVVEHISGTPGYICPIYFETGEVNELSEVFSFGVVLLELLVNRDAAARGPDGGIIYPLHESVQYTNFAAHERVMACLDIQAAWPLNRLSIACAVSQLALACVGEPTRRPPFAQIAWELRHIALEPRVDSFDAPILKGSSIQHSSRPEGTTLETKGFHTILPASFLEGLETSARLPEASFSGAGRESLAESFASAFPSAVHLYTRLVGSSTQPPNEPAFHTMLLNTIDTNVSTSQKSWEQQPPHSRLGLNNPTAIGLRAKLAAKPATFKIDLDRIVGI